jgi:ubiquinone/menaquinone biosynthesis C-methylase UbiE
MTAALPREDAEPPPHEQGDSAGNTTAKPVVGVSAQTTPQHATANLYNERFERFGRDVRTVGWGSRADQVLRFDVLLRGLNLKGKTVLDVGCGLGDLVPYLQERTGGDFAYIGVDIADRLVADAQQLHGGKRCRFLHGDAFREDLPQVDIAVLSGALSLRTEDIADYAHRTLQRMYALAREAACLNFLSKYVDYELEKNQHYQPETVFAWARRITPRLNLLNDYPLYEFTVQLLRPHPKPS